MDRRALKLATAAQIARHTNEQTEPLPTSMSRFVWRCAPLLRPRLAVQVLPARRAIKGVRRVEIGPFVTVNFENFDLIWIQIHEMLRIERGGEEQIKDEIEAYEPLIPRNGNICATLMIEIDNREKRRRELSQLGFIENTVRLQIGDVSVVAAPLGDDDVPRTDENGRTSAVHFLRFHFDDEAVARVREADEAHLIIEHDHYRHSTRLRPELVQEICRDLKR